MVVYLYNYTYTTWRQVLGDDVVNFFEGVASVPRGLYRFGDYLGRISGLRDWQEGSVIASDYYRDQAIEETKYTYKMIKFIIFNEKLRDSLIGARDIALDSGKKYIMNNKARLTGRFITLQVFSRPIPPVKYAVPIGDISFSAHEVDEFVRQVILGE